MRILIAEDDQDISILYKRALEKRKHSVILTSTGEACLENYLDIFHNMKSTYKYDPAVITTKAKVKSSFTSSKTISSSNLDNKGATPLNLYDAVILDYKMPGMNGMS